MSRKLLDSLPWIGLVLLATTFGQLFLHSDFKLARELSLVDIATALLTLFLAFYIPSRLERRLSSQRFELEVLIRSVERVQTEFTAIRNTVLTATVPASAEQMAAIVQAFTNISHGIHTLTELSTICNRADVQPLLTDLQKRRLAFKRLVTGGGFQRDPAFAYKIAQVALIGQQYYEADLALSKLIIYINRA